MKKILTPVAAAMLWLAASCSGTPVEFTVLQWNVWQEGTVVPGGYDAIVDEIARLQPDFVTLSEVRNYGGTKFTERLTASLRARGLEYRSFRSDGSGLLSRHPIIDSATVFPLANDQGSIYRLVAEVGGHEIAVYTAHLDYRHCAYYNVRGYDGSTWAEIPAERSVERILEINTASQRDDAIRAFVADARREAEAGRCIVLGGDLNEPSHLDWTEATASMYGHGGLVVPWTVTSLLEEAGYGDAFRTVYPDPVTHPGFTYPAANADVPVGKLTWAPKADERERIDFVFYRGEGLQPVTARIFGPAASIVRSEPVEERSDDIFLPPAGIWPTDHKGVWVKFTIR